MNLIMHLPVARASMGGGSIAMWRLREALVARGHKVRVTAGESKADKLRGARVRDLTQRDLRWSDAVLTTASSTAREARHFAARRGRPVALFVHSARFLSWLPKHPRALVVWGSAALRTRATQLGVTSGPRSIVMWPLIAADQVRTTPGERVTLVNLMAEKGADLFWALVERMPDVPFLAVKGGWGRQVIPKPLPPNVQLMPYTGDARRIYEATRVLLYMRGKDAGPDWLNGVGMTALEAAVSGIPTVAHPGPGLVESLGPSGTFVDSDEPEAWDAALRAALEPTRYHELSAAALARAAALDPNADLDRLLAALRALRSQP